MSGIVTSASLFDSLYDMLSGVLSDSLGNLPYTARSDLLADVRHLEQNLPLFHV